MFKKYSILVWLILLLILAGIYVIVEYTGSADRTFKSKVLTFESEKVSSLLINNKQEGTITEIKIENDAWTIHEGGRSYSCEPKAVSSILDELNNLSTESIVATKSDKWAEYKVDEQQAILVDLFEGDKRLERLYVGKFNFKAISSADPQQQQGAKMTSYIRTEGDDMVYAVDGILRTNFSEGVEPFRNRKLFWIDQAEDISKISISSHYENIVVDLSTPEWKVNNMPVDSGRTARFISKLARLSNSSFINDVDVSTMAPAYTMTIEGSTFEPVILMAYPADTIIGHYVTSSANIGSVFDGSKSNLFGKIFVGTDSFLPE